MSDFLQSQIDHFMAISDTYNSNASALGSFTDNSSGAFQYQPEPVGGTYRGLASSWFNKRNIEKENWMRDQQAATNDMIRQNYLDEQAFERSKWMTEHQYELATKGMQAAGLNPILAYQSAGAASAGSAGSAGSSSRSHSEGGDPANTVLGVIGALISTLVAGKYKVASAAAGAANQVFNSYTANYHQGNSYNRYYKK